jgi:hypothetical protein
LLIRQEVLHLSLQLQLTAELKAAVSMQVAAASKAAAGVKFVAGILTYYGTFEEKHPHLRGRLTTRYRMLKSSYYGFSPGNDICCLDQI